jgi:HD superfamily phosphohydrolase YqeK
MTPLETIIYFADYIEETRKDEVCVELREKYLSLLEKTEKSDALNKALVLSFDYTIVNLMEKSKIIDQNTINARNYYLLKTLTK